MLNRIYKVHINDRGYTSWVFHTTTEFQEVELPAIIPANHKLLTNDVFSLDENETLTLLHSSIRVSESIPGVLILKNNKTYGRQNGANGKLFYKCIPDDMRLPSFLVPYEIRHMGFSKVFTNLYVTFQFKEWTDKHPHAILSQVIGSVDVLDNFYEYQLYCKSLNASIQKFTKDTSKALKSNSHDAFIQNISKKYPSIENRTDRSKWKIFTIDPEGSLDYDDAFSLITLDTQQQQQLSIYISNVTIWMDVLNLWESFSRRISTIYLPDRKRPMLPTILSDCLCSLQSNHTRLAFVMDIFIDADGNIIEIKYSNCTINVFRNFVYEEPELVMNSEYLALMDTTKKLSKKYKYISNVRNSHEIVCYLMITMNYYTAKEMLKSGNGIFRSTIMKRDITIPDELPEDVTKFIKIWNSAAGQYIDASILAEGQTITHDMLEMDAYIHITSPIRRLVDLLNIIQFQQNTGIIHLSENSNKFYRKWLSELDYINTTMRSIRRVQNDCSLLHLCSTNPEVMSKTYEGYTFDKIIRNDGLFQFVVFLPELRLTSRLVLRENLNNFEKSYYKLFLFHDEEKFKKKIRLQLVS
uniref:RNB domain-containing protein n=1 Tax=viral metagenome TaxID=1070528 RepID=A0A6C0HCL4_9ZZZZ